MNTRRSVRSTGATVAVAAAAVFHVQVTTFILIGIAALLATILFGVVLPAVWSRKAARRRAAVQVLRQLLEGSASRPRS
jgi:hypothetical protein